MNRLIGILSVCAVLIFSSCEKDGVLSTTYNITPWLQFENGGASFFVSNVKAYAYYGDTAYWKVDSWDDALAGIVTNKEDGSKLAPVYEATPDADYMMSMGPLTQEQLMLLVCYTAPDEVGGAKMYAWRNAKIIENLPQIYVDLVFKPWRENYYYSDSRWAMYNDKWLVAGDETESAQDELPHTAVNTGADNNN